MNRARDEKFMRAALNEAKKALGKTSPNPAVGAVLVVDDLIVSRGHHRGAGRDHAEVECLRNFGAKLPARATLYVTLEPCSTRGRTAPCTEAILQADVRNVVVGAIDVNPRHSGKWIVTDRPFVIAKCGMSLDGRLTRPGGEPRWITERSARLHSHQLRSQVDAILVGANTVRTDNPRLTVRSVRGARQPWRVVLTRSGTLSRHAYLFSDRFNSRTLIYQGKSLATVLKNLGERGITSVLLEGGGDVLGQALDARLIDKVQIYLGPILTGGPIIAFPGRGAETAAHALRLRRVSYRQIGQSVCIMGYPEISQPE